MILHNAFTSIALRYDGNKLLQRPTEEKAKEYIKQYFNNRGKSSVFNIALSNKDLKDSDVLSKSMHTVSAFLLGFHMKSIIDTVLLEEIKNIFSDWSYDFEYTWFITCLYHDTISGIEKKEHIENKLDYSMFQSSMVKYELPTIPFTFEENVVNSYYKYRLREMGSTDHGILGGCLLFEKLAQNYENNFKKEKQKNPTISIECFTTNQNGRTLIWERNHLWHFAYVSNAIIAHNIWFVVEGTKDAEKYKTMGLERLIVNTKTENRIKREQDPLVFFLALIDTIEPVKYFDKLLPQFVWKHISIGFINDNNEVIIEADENIFNMKKWYNDKIKDLSKWLYIEDINPPQNGRITIKL